MALPAPVEALWNELQSVRTQLLKETEGLSQAQADWRPSEQDWSIGEILHHLVLAEVGTGKLTSKLFKDAPSRVHRGMLFDIEAPEYDQARAFMTASAILQKIALPMPTSRVAWWPQGRTSA